MPQTKTISLAIASAALLGACAATPPVYYSQATAKHVYAVTVKSKSGPVAGANVTFDNFTGRGTGGANPVDCVTDINGVCSTQIEVYRDSDYSVTNTFHSGLSYRVSKEGYYSKKGSLSSDAGYGDPSPADSAKRVVNIFRPVDYLADDFLKSTSDAELRDQAMQFIELLRVQSLLNDAEVKVGGVGTSAFKNKKYFQMKVDSTITFNTLKLDKYEIGKRVFDDTIRKILNPLNEHISSPTNFFGYDLVVFARSRSFGSDSEPTHTTEYRYLIPQDVVRRYKNQDISGQQVLDASVLLMDNDRIELKLQ